MKHFARGNAAPETAFAISFVLIVLFGVVQIATTTFYQVSADGASFVGSHDTVAQFANPTASNQPDAYAASQTSFSKIVSNSIKVLNPSTSTFETDVTQQIPGISALGNPAALTINSRIVEESAGTTGGSGTGSGAEPPAVLDCSTAAESIASSASATGSATAAPIISQAIGLTQGAATIVPISITSGTALNLNPAPVVNELSVLNAVEAQLAATVTAIQAVPATITTALAPVNAILSTLGLGGQIQNIQTGVTNAVGQGITSALGQATSGNLTVQAAGVDVAQINLNISKLTGLQVGTVAYNAVVTAIDPILNTLFGQAGPLGVLNAAENTADKALDSKIPVCPTPAPGN